MITLLFMFAIAGYFVVKFLQFLSLVIPAAPPRTAREDAVPMLVSAGILVAMIILCRLVIPRWGAAIDRKVPEEFIKAWSGGGKQAAYAIYDHRAEFRDVFFETFVPASVAEVKDDGEGSRSSINLYGPSETYKCRRFLVKARATREGEPLELVLGISVAKDTHKVCGVDALTVRAR